MPVGQKFWTQREEIILREEYPLSEWDRLLDLFPDRSEASIRGKAFQMGLKRSVTWTPEEDQILKDNYEHAAWDKLLRLLPNRTKKAIIRRGGSHLGLRRPRWWSKQEDKILKNKYTSSDWDALLEALPNRTRSAIISRAATLGISWYGQNYNSAAGKLFSQYKSGARRRGYAWTLARDLFLEITQDPCHYCGVDPQNEILCGEDSYTHNGIDRIDNNRGYTEDNVVPCCHRCNIAKRDAEYDEFIEWLERIYLHFENIS